VETSSTRTILVVEDEPQVRRLIGALLRRNGFSVIEAGGGHQALAASRDYPGVIHLALIDVGMPGMGGLDVANDLLPGRPDMKVLYISGMVNSVAVNSLSEQAPHLVVRKPFSSKELLRRIADALD
jgi:CheY-like chemotaxis protein